MIKRRLETELKRLVKEAPAVVLLGPRQVGKTTLAHSLTFDKETVYLDLESDTDNVKLSDPESYLSAYESNLVILDEVHRKPELFKVLRGLIDSGRRKGIQAGRFLLLGSASLDLLKQSGETLAGRIATLELSPFDVLEVGKENTDALWVRGGFPGAFLAADDESSMRWRRAFVSTYLERDIPQFGSRVPAETMRRFWSMLAHNQITLLNAAHLARSIGADSKTVVRYIDLLVDILLVRRLPAWHKNVGKRLVKSPKVYIRDSGLLHALLGISGKENLLGHPVVGASWEAFVIETLIRVAPGGTAASFYRSATGDEIDLVLEFADGSLWAIEVKRGNAPHVEPGFYRASAIIRAQKNFVVYGGDEKYTLAQNVEAISLFELTEILSQHR